VRFNCAPDVREKTPEGVKAQIIIEIGPLCGLFFDDIPFSVLRRTHIASTLYDPRENASNISFDWQAWYLLVSTPGKTICNLMELNHGELVRDATCIRRDALRHQAR
jgi:hypothetical protein